MRGKPYVAEGSDLTQQGGTSPSQNNTTLTGLMYLLSSRCRMLPQQAAGLGGGCYWGLGRESKENYKVPRSNLGAADGGVRRV